MASRHAIEACMADGALVALLAYFGGLAACTAPGETRQVHSASADAGPPRALERRETVCFNTDRSVVAVNDEGIWTSKGQVFDAEGRQRLSDLKLSCYGMLASVAFDHDLIVAAGTPDPDGSLSYWIEAFAKDGRRLWAVNLDPSEAFEDSPISVKVAIVPQSGTVSVVMYGQAYESDGDARAAGHVRPRATNLAELRSYSRDGKLLARRKLTHLSVEKAAFSATGELALAGTADHRLDLGFLTGSRQRWIRAGSAFAAHYDQDGRPQWDRAFTGPRRLSADILFDDAGNLWTALFTCGARGAESYSVIGGSGPVRKLVLEPLCTGYYVISRSGAGDQREIAIAPCSSLSWAKRCPKREDPLFLGSAGFALLGEGGRVFGVSRDPIPGRQVIDLRSANREGSSYYLWPVSDAGPGVRLPGTVEAAGFFRGSLCMAVNTTQARLRCDRWVGTTRSHGPIVVCLPANPKNTNPGGPS